MKKFVLSLVVVVALVSAGILIVDAFQTRLKAPPALVEKIGKLAPDMETRLEKMSGVNPYDGKYENEHLLIRYSIAPITFGGEQTYLIRMDNYKKTSKLSYKPLYKTVEFHVMSDGELRYKRSDERFVTSCLNHFATL